MGKKKNKAGLMKQADVEDVAAQVKTLTETWNPPPVADDLRYVLGAVAEEHDGRETQAAVNPDAFPTGDNQIQYNDDGDDPEDDDAVAEDYSDEDKWTFAALKEEIDARNMNLPEDDRISKGGGRDDLVARLLEDDAEREDPDGD